MNKRDLAAAVANKLNMSCSEMESIMDAVNETIVEALVNGDHVTMWNFGRYEMKHQAARVGRSFATGETLTIPEGDKIIFTVSPKLQATLDSRA